MRTRPDYEGGGMAPFRTAMACPCRPSASAAAAQLHYSTVQLQLQCSTTAALLVAQQLLHYSCTACATRAGHERMTARPHPPSQADRRRGEAAKRVMNDATNRPGPPARPGASTLFLLHASTLSLSLSRLHALALSVATLLSTAVWRF